MSLIPPAGRFAPSPTSDLHIGNLRTAMLAWILARRTNRRFLIRFENLDQVRVTAAPAIAQQQLQDLTDLGLDWDDKPTQQSDLQHRYVAAVQHLETYECFCTRKEIAESAQAPHGEPSLRRYPGTCRDLTPAQRQEKRAHRPPALRVKADQANQSIIDLWAGNVSGVVDDFVIKRNDGTWAYNFACVIDDLTDGVDQVCRGEDLLGSAPRQAWLCEQRGGHAPTYAHVGLAVNAVGQRLAKRDGAVTLTDLRRLGYTPAQVRARIGASLGLTEPGEPITMDQLAERFDVTIKPKTWVVSS